MDIELAYVWIGENETGFIKNQGFNFLPNYKFEMEFREGEGYRLNCTYIEDYPNVWKTGNIVGLTAVVGENGTGKTSLMNWILSPRKDEYGLRMYKCGNDFYVSYHLNHNITFWTDPIYKHGEKPASFYMTNAHGRRTNNPWNNLNVFSPESDIRFHFRASHFSSNLAQTQEEFDYLYGKNERIEFNKLSVIYYYHQQFEKQHNHGSIKYDDLPTVNSALTIGFSRDFFAVIRKIMRTGTVNGNHIHRKLLQRYRDWLRETPYFAERAWLMLIIELSYITGNWNPYNQLLCATYVKPYANDLLGLYRDSADYSAEIADYYTQAVEELEILEKLICSTEIPPLLISNKGSVENLISLSYRDKPEVYREFCGFISSLLHKNDSFVLRNLSFDMSDLSSGEWAVQNICAWLLIASHSDSRYITNPNNTILLLLDEVDLYMHPEWQRKFLNFLSKELALQFKDYRIQIVITTHSPLILSDVPSGNIIYLRKEGCECTVENGCETSETFGANIHTLLKDSFYLQRSLGEFAYSKIREVIDDLLGLKNWGKENPSEKQQELEEKFTYEEHLEKCRKHKQLIDIIGEPVVKGKLQRLYAELFPNDLDKRVETRLTDFRQMLKTMDSAKRERYMAELDHMLSAMKGRQD